MATKIINISLPEELVKKIDKAAMNDYASRSDYIREAVVRKLRAGQLDEFGDPIGLWEDGIDLRGKKGQGMPAKNFLAVLKKAKKAKQ